jgi:hypothetical protein
MNQFDTYVVNINLDDKTPNKTVNDLITRFGVDNDNVIYMSKNEYNKYVFNNCGNTSFYNKKNHDDKICTICHNNFKKNNKIFQLHNCNHQFHYKCIEKWFKSLSNNFTNIRSCPLCRSSTESIIEY